MTTAGRRRPAAERRARDLAADAALDEGRAAGLTDEERSALALLVRHAGEIVRSEELYTAVWGELEFDNADEIHRISARQRIWRLMSHLRRKIESVPAQRSLIQTVQGAGYRIE